MMGDLLDGPTTPAEIELHERIRREAFDYEIVRHLGATSPSEQVTQAMKRAVATADLALIRHRLQVAP